MIDDRCNQHREALPLYLYGALPPPRRDEISAHLSTCPGCSAAADRLRQWQEQIREASRVDPPPSFWQDYRRTLRGRIPEKRNRFAKRFGRFEWTSRPAFVAMMGLLLVGAVALWLTPKPHSTQRLVPVVEHPEAAETLDLVQNLGMFENLTLLEEMDALEESDTGLETERTVE
ncbi:MAG: zf-HC2 domain-containing protein [Nitrospirae bacterium]|nr:zf-HC2 domain-containing protein [Candidatus Manganitrophaceae bacterium]